MPLTPAGSASEPMTGGQYSLVRAALGAYLTVRLALLLPYAAELFSSAGMVPDGTASPLLRAFPNVLALVDTPAFVAAFVATGVVAALLLAAGWHDRAAALYLAYLGACLFGRNPLIANPSLPFVGWMLLAHALLPPAPYGSWAARDRADPGGGWTFPRSLHVVAWIVMAASYSYSGWCKLDSPSWLDGTALRHVLENPLARPIVLRDLLSTLPPAAFAAMTWSVLALEIAYAPLALVARLRPWLWLVMAAMHVGLVALIDFAELSAGMLLLHAFTFDPAWVPAKVAPAPGIVRYDGGCALCHGWVRFLLAEDRTPGGAFRFAPLEEGAQAATIVVETGTTRLERSDAVLHILEHLGGAWRVAGTTARLLPRRARDTAYDFVARSRRRVFGTTKDACPMMPREMRARFVA
jgi:predicted DCC family thiol-disulfide oxidoreductase YuxK